MFRGPFDESSDEEATTADEEPIAFQNAAKGASTGAPTNQTASTAPAGRDDPHLQPAARTARASLFLANLPSQTMTEEEIAEAQATIQAAQTPLYGPSRTADTIHPNYPVHLNGFQSANATTPNLRVPSTRNPRAPSTPNQIALSNSNTWRPDASDPQTIARLALLPPPPPLMNTEEIETMLAPVKTELEKLKGTRMPPDTGRVASKSAMQVLRDRLLPVGRFITQQIADVEEDRRGAAETELFRYIAEHYWPQVFAQVDGLRLMEMYRNTIYLERIRHEQWLAEVEVEAERGRADEEEEARRLEALEDGFVDEREDEMPGLIDEDVWRSPGAEGFRPVPLLGEVIPELEIDDTDDERDVGMADSGSWRDLVRSSWGQPKGG